MRMVYSLQVSDRANSVPFHHLTEPVKRLNFNFNRPDVQQWGALWIFNALRSSPIIINMNRVQTYFRCPHLPFLPSWLQPRCWADPHPSARSLRTPDKLKRNQHRRCPTWSWWSSSHSTAAALWPGGAPDSQPGSYCRKGWTTRFQTGTARTTGDTGENNEHFRSYDADILKAYTVSKAHLFSIDESA